MKINSSIFILLAAFAPLICLIAAILFDRARNKKLQSRRKRKSFCVLPDIRCHFAWKKLLMPSWII